MITALIPVLTSLIERVFPDQEAADKAKAEMMVVLAQAEKERMKAKSDVVVAEAKGESSAQRNWRPHLMYLFMFIIGFNFILAPIAGMLGLGLETLPIPEHMWLLLTVGVGGYIAGRSGEKISANFSKKKFYDALRDEKGYLDQQDVNELENVFKKMGR